MIGFGPDVNRSEGLGPVRPAAPTAVRPSSNSALRFILLLGIVGLFANATYEGGRSATGAYLADLGASGLVVGMAAGLGELTSYGLRLLSGYVADRTGRYWTFLLLGYSLNMAAVPLLALTGHWQAAVGLMLAERLGKGIRTPVRDALLSHASRQVGTGWGFGIHELLDQVGAVVGPLLFAWILSGGGGYHLGFGLLLIPAVTTLVALLSVRRLYPQPRDLDTSPPLAEGGPLPAAFWLTLVATALVAAGYVDFPLIAYHLGREGEVSPPWIPVTYAVGMAVDAVAALMFGRLYDRFGVVVLIGVVVLSAWFAPLIFYGGLVSALLGMALWGVGIGALKTIMRAVIARTVCTGRRGFAYGLFSTVFGVSWFLGSATKGFLYDLSPGALVLLSVIAQLAALPVLALTWRGGEREPYSPPGLPSCA